jgi:restriction system protein
MICDVKQNAETLEVRRQPIRRAPPPTPTQPMCPQCSSPMVLRTAKQGAHAGSQFYGCSRFPACRGIRAYRTDEG